MDVLLLVRLELRKDLRERFMEAAQGEIERLRRRALLRCLSVQVCVEKLDELG